MNYTEALEYIHSVCWMGSRPGLERITELCRCLGDPQKGMKFIHVAGTNGKGSFCAMTASILRQAGYRTGLYVSPYVKHFNERMSIDGVDISDDELAEITSYVRLQADSMQSKPTEFELITAIAFVYFKRHNCDVVVLETGMGGRLDATNIIDSPLLSVITGIALDHVAFLGDTVEKIAAEKAGIIKAGAPVHWGGKDEAAGRVIAERAEQIGVEFNSVDYSKLKNVRPSIDGTTFDYGEYSDLKIQLLGLYQPENAASVVSAIPLLRARGLNISDDDVRRGLEATRWAARFELLSTSPTVIYDGSHNPQGIEAAVRSIKGLFGARRVNILTGVLRDKDYRYIAATLSSVADRVWCVTPANERALAAAEYAELFRSCGRDAVACDTLVKGVAAAFEDSNRRGIPMVALGSLYMYAEFCAALDGVKGNKMIYFQ
ncbi:MAG: bifunctional folylpolyglutamate synthase/dihydrofolate synthase [Clostridia bacterium]|nr:bifunctional folylpolyglutamate synthase/dihydrofolate synthase [Clostridia bacterium]